MFDFGIELETFLFNKPGSFSRSRRNQLFFKIPMEGRFNMYSREIKQIEDSSLKKIEYLKQSPWGYLLLSALAGAYIGFGIILIFSIGGPFSVSADAHFLKLIMGVSFGIALSLVIFSGAELFTGNNMVFAVGRLGNKVGWGAIVVLFVMCYVGNFIGSILLAFLVSKGGSLPDASHQLILKVSSQKMNLEPMELFIRGILCNWLVCLAIWMSNRTSSDSAKLMVIFWCLFAFIASGFEHSIANMTLLGYALMIPHGLDISIWGFIYNQIWVVAGNLCGGALMVGSIYWFIASNPEKKETAIEKVELSRLTKLQIQKHHSSP